jgi:hypothetical protein
MSHESWVELFSAATVFRAIVESTHFLRAVLLLWILLIQYPTLSNNNKILKSMINAIHTAPLEYK